MTTFKVTFAISEHNLPSAYKQGYDFKLQIYGRSQVWRVLRTDIRVIKLSQNDTWW